MPAEPFDLSGGNPWTTLARRIVFENERARVLDDEVIQPDGAVGHFTYVELPGPVVGIVPVTDSHEVYLVRQWRYPWGRNSWEIPAGHAQPGEEPLAAAQRELAEEAGLRADHWEPLGVGYGSALLTAPYVLYLARDLEPVPRPQRDPGEADMVVGAAPLAQAVTAAMNGAIVHSFSVIGILRAARRLGL